MEDFGSLACNVDDITFLRLAIFLNFFLAFQHGGFAAVCQKFVG